MPEPACDPAGLTSFQLELAQLFFSLPESAGFLLAGGAALAAQHLTTRPTRDLDFFTGPDRGNVPNASAALEVAAGARGWTARRVRHSPTFCRLVISGPHDVLVDLALDSPPTHASVPSMAGPTFALEELAGRKVIALFDERKHENSPTSTLLPTLTRFTDDELPVDPAEAQRLRTFFADWATELQP